MPGSCTLPESAIPLLERNIAASSGYYQSATPEALVLDWDDDEFPEAIKNLDGFDVILYVPAPSQKKHDL